MTELSLPLCPICYAPGSLARQSQEIAAGRTLVWYECRECASVLVGTGGGQWTYQKIGRPDKAHLLKQPLAVSDLLALLASGGEAPRYPVETGMALAPVDSRALTVPARAKREFPDLHYRAFQHPLDREALKALEKVKFLDVAVRKLSEWFSEKSLRLLHVSSNLRLGPRQCPSLYTKFVEAAATLDVRKLPEVYVDSSGTINAYASGMENYTITLCSGLIDMLTEDELLAVIGHELGHIKCDHQLYKTMAYILTVFGADLLSSMLPLGVGTVATLGIQLAIFHWYRMAEFSCDRAALLVVQDPQVVASTLTKLAGYSPKILPEINMEEVLRQADEYEEMGDKFLEKALKLLQAINQTHPMPIVRVKEILKWSRSPEYQAILAGDYLTTAAEQQAVPVPVTPIEGPIGLLCPGCNGIVPVHVQFCVKCGARLRGAARVCTRCRNQVAETWKICSHCGAKLLP